MHEPFYPLPLPAHPESGFGSLLARVARRLTARLRRPRPDPPLRFPLHPPGF